MVALGPLMNSSSIQLVENSRQETVTIIVISVN